MSILTNVKISLTIKKLLKTDDENEIKNILENTDNTHLLFVKLQEFIMKKVKKNPELKLELYPRYKKIDQIQSQITKELLSDIGVR